MPLFREKKKFKSSVIFVPGSIPYLFNWIYPDKGVILRMFSHTGTYFFSNLDGNFNEFDSGFASSNAKEYGSFSYLDQQPWIKLQSMNKVPIAAFWRTFQLMEKSAQPGKDGGCTSTHFTLVAITYKVSVYAPAERADTYTPPYFVSATICTYRQSGYVVTVG